MSGLISAAPVTSALTLTMSLGDTCRSVEGGDSCFRQSPENLGNECRGDVAVGIQGIMKEHIKGGTAWGLWEPLQAYGLVGANPLISTNPATIPEAPVWSPPWAD